MRLRSVLNRLPVFLLIFGLLLFASFFWTTLHGSIDEEKHEIKVAPDERDSVGSGGIPDIKGDPADDEEPDDDVPDDDLPDVDDDEDFDNDEDYDDDEAYEEAQKALADEEDDTGEEAAPDEEAEDDTLKALAAEDDEEGSAEEARAEEEAEEEALEALAAEDDDGSPPIAPLDTQGGGESTDEPPAGQPAKGTGQDSSESDYLDESARDAESEQSAASGEDDYQGYEEEDAPLVAPGSTKDSVEAEGTGETGATAETPSDKTVESTASESTASDRTGPAKESDGSEDKTPQDTAGSKDGSGGQKSPAANPSAEPQAVDGGAGPAAKPAEDVYDADEGASKQGDLFLPEGPDAEGHEINFSPQYRPPEKSIDHSLLDLTKLEAGLPKCFDSMSKPKTFLYFMSSHTGSTAMMSQLVYHPETHWVHGLGTMEPLNRPGMTNNSRAEVEWTRGFFGDAVKLDRLGGFKLNLSPIHGNPDAFAQLVREFDTAIILNTRKNLLKRAVGRYPFYYMHDSTTVAGLRHGTSMEERCEQGIGCQYAVRPAALHCLMARSYFVMEELRSTVEDLTKAAGKAGCFLEAPYEDYLYYPDETIVQIEKFLHLDPVVVESMREKATSDNMCDVIENYAEVCAHFSDCSRWKWMLEDDRNGCSCTKFEYESVGGDGVNPLCDLELVEDEELECPFAKNLRS